MRNEAVASSDLENSVSYKTLGSEPSSTWSSPSSSFLQWDYVTARTAELATLPFLLMQVPQIILNTQNLIKGHKRALYAVQWTAQLTSLAGNLSLMSYFVNKRERGATVVQGVGVATTLIVLLQLAIAGAMPLPAFLATAVSCLVGFTVNSFHYRSLLNAGIWRLWQDIIGVVGLFVLTQMIWSTFSPYLPPSILPGIVFAAVDILLILLLRVEKLPGSMANMMGGISGWTATLLFMWSPIAQLYTNFLDPSNIEGLSVFTILLALIGNGMLIPRALFTRDFMWFTGASWGCLVQGWGLLLSMYLYHAISIWLFWPMTVVLALWIGLVFSRDMKAYSLRSPFDVLTELVSGCRSYSVLY